MSDHAANGHMCSPRHTKPKPGSSLTMDGLLECYIACQEFVRKVECGEAQSTRSYAQMKAAIKRTEELRKDPQDVRQS